MSDTYQSFYAKAVCWGCLLVPALLLTTPNYSVAIIGFIILASIGYLIINKPALKLQTFDKIVIFCLAWYFVGAIPVAINDGETGRYFQGGIRLLAAIPTYLALIDLFKKKSLPIRKYLEIGVILGSLGAFVLAYYQLYFLKMPRVDGFLFSINFGYLACSLSFLALSLSIKSNNKLWLAAAFCLSTVSVVLTFTRGAIFAIPLLLILFPIFQLKSINPKFLVAAIVAFLSICIFSYQYSSSVKNRIDYTVTEFSNIANGNINRASSSGDRLQYWFGATEAFKKSPIFGLSFRERKKLNHQLFLEGKMGERASKVQRGHAHSQYFELIASNGILGIVTIMTSLFIPLILMILHYKKTSSDWAFSGALFVSGFAIFALTEALLTANLIGFFYGFMLSIFFAQVSVERHAANIKSTGLS